MKNVKNKAILQENKFLWWIASKLQIVGMGNMQNVLQTGKWSFLHSFSVCMTVPLSVFMKNISRLYKIRFFTQASNYAWTELFLFL